MSKECFYAHSIEEALQCWSDSGLVAIPTETVFGLAAPINNDLLLKKIFSYKERPFYDPLIIHVSNFLMAKDYAYWDELSEKLAQSFWPGPLTLVLPKKKNVSDIITSGLNTVGIRCPQHSLTLSLIEKLGVPLAAPSANKFTKTSPTTAKHVYDSFQGNHLCILKNDEKVGDVGIESTIVQVKGNVITILRPGMVTAAHIKEALKDHKGLSINYGKTAVEMTETSRTAPGQEITHYQPDYPLFLHKEEDGALEQGWANSELELSELENVLLDLDPVICAREIYTLLRRPIGKYKGRVFTLPRGRLEQVGASGEQWQSIENRLTKAGRWI
jgi:L-threonylcarbamoyladenylate synthase